VTDQNGPDAIETLGLVLISGNDLQIPPQGTLQDVGQVRQSMEKS
jgi:hypothetical protein